MSGWMGAAAVVLAWVVAVNVGRVRRLDRLHRRLDATRIALAAALEARRDGAGRVAAVLDPPGVGGTHEPRSERSSRALPPDALASGALRPDAVLPGPAPVGSSRSAERDAADPGAVAGPRSAERGGVAAGVVRLTRSAERDEAVPQAVDEVRSAERGASLRAAVVAARCAGPDREAAENALGRELVAVDRSRLPEGLRAEVAEAELRLALARRVHNDAVRDTLALRSRRSVRWLRLAGTAPMPAYFEIADPPGVTGPALPTTPANPPG